MNVMKASVYAQYGSPTVLRIKEVDKPVPKDKEVLIRVYATTVNRTDCAMLRAKPFIMRFLTGLFRPSNPILGTDFAGKVEALGKDVLSFKVGDRVFGFDDSGISSHAQYMTFSEDNALATIPSSLSYEHAAASIEGAHYAYNFINKVDILPGQKVLVNGATGAIGSAAVQLLKYYGAQVTAVGNTKNISLMKSLGADQVMDYTKEDFTQTTEKYHYIFDSVGKSTFARCKPLLEIGGVYISSELGPYIQNPFLALITPFFGNQKVVFPIPTDKKKSVLLIKKLSEEGKFKAVIDKKYPLEDIADAFRYVETGQKTGNVVITYED
ncbi:NAD(P)-dependent alcohol dehydrogenase [Catalinimonas niigatensis]|uniref:NAD(P)-dependent alcohol dehydrogenase n=1 Tax=Catalinimonas niigatensis TaxID=1397264 RepID=UPI0026671000|nr:NAD(P)-dependent alcohol dehydrogenase [Catalinimonas niigatensis]WPP51173.1 NAD(P)-dependent alcohol dehydrogenase [Catalinimonas niigatensis]